MRDGQVAGLCIGSGIGLVYLWCAIVALVVGRPRLGLLLGAAAIVVIAFNLGVVFTS